MSENQSKFDIWWNDPKTKRIVGAAYSIGASVVILGAMFKILHLTGAAEMLMIGMTTEAILFGLGIFDKPHKEMEWDKVFDMESGIKMNTGSMPNAPASVSIKSSSTINDEDMSSLSEGIRNLTKTANQFASLSDVMGSTKEFVKNIDAASTATGKFTQSQETLNSSVSSLNSAYSDIANNMDAVEKNTKAYATKVDDINKSLSSINSMYEIQLKNIQAQAEGMNKASEGIELAGKEIGQITTEIQKMKSAVQVAATETDAYKTGTEKLAKQIAELNQVYGNMLNAMN